jgi:hypothetical protein
VTVERKCAILEGRPVPGGRSERRYDGTIDATGRPARIEIPRWIRPAGLPVLLLRDWALAGALPHAVFVFLALGLVALPLDPLARAVEHVPPGRFRIPPGLAVAGVYLGFAAAVAFAIVGLATVGCRPDAASI